MRVACCCKKNWEKKISEAEIQSRRRRRKRGRLKNGELGWEKIGENENETERTVARPISSPACARFAAEERRYFMTDCRLLLLLLLVHVSTIPNRTVNESSKSRSADHSAPAAATPTREKEEKKLCLALFEKFTIIMDESERGRG